MSGWQFPHWNYGYTQMPAYNYYPSPGQPPYPGQAPPQPRPPAPPTKPAPESVKVETPASPATIKKEPVINRTEVKPEEGEIVEKSVLGILRGRNPVMFCNDQSKIRNLHMEWEQVKILDKRTNKRKLFIQISEIGPPHDKTYEYQLKMGEIIATGVGKNKKDAKTKAAEGMVLKLDDLPKVGFKRPFHQGGWGQGGGWGRGGYHGGGHGGPHWKKRKGESEDQILRQNDVTPKAENPSQNNPISKLYEFSKKRKWPEPIFDCTSEEVLEERRTEKGFTLRKTNFTIRCTVRRPPGQVRCSDWSELLILSSDWPGRGQRLHG